jgi:DNA-binding GntR family transcriptional regulator
MTEAVPLAKDGTRLQRQVAGQIARHVLALDLEPGTPLTELALADAFRVSRTPVRAALDLLAETGLVENEGRRGFVVADAPRDAWERFDEGSEDEEALYMRIASEYLSGAIGDNFSEADLLRRFDVGRAVLNRVLRRMAVDLVISRNQGRGWSFAPMLKSADAEAESYRFRMVIEPAAILEPGYALDRQRALASRRAHEEILATDPARLSPFQFFAVNAEFHELVAAGSGNGFMAQAVQQQNRLRRLLNLQWPQAAQRVAESCAEHLNILDALEAGDNEWAASLLRRHLELAARLGSAETPVSAS